MRKLALALILAPLCGAFFMGAPALAQKTKAELAAEVSTTFPDNTSGLITPSGVRTFQNDLINSIMPTAPVVSGNLACFNGTTGLLQDCGTAPDTITIGITNVASGTSSRVLYNNAGKVAEYAITGTGSVVMSSGAAIDTPTIASPTFSGTASGAGTLPTTLLSGTLQDSNFGALTGDVTTLGGSYATSIAANAVTNAKMATMAANTVKGNATGGSAVPTDVAPAAARSSSLLNIDSFTGHGDSIYTILPTDRVVGTNAAFTASRTWTLPAANAVNPGQSILVADFQGTVTGSNTLVIARAGSDTINGGISVTISSANGAFLLVSDGTSKWTAQAVGAAAASGVSSLDGATGAISAQAGSFKVVGSTLSGNVLSSRTFAATQDLSSFSSIQTLGYSTAGDGGGATFKKVVAGTILPDAFVNCNPCTIAGGSGYPDGTYNGVPLSGACVVQAVVSGGAVTQVNFAVPCIGQQVGNVLSVNNSYLGGSGSGFTITITSVSTPHASFTDASGNLWQYQSNGFVNALQFGCVGDWNGVDASATNNIDCLWSAIAFASNPISTSAALVYGNQVWLPRGAYMTCGIFLNSVYNIPIPTGVTLTGAGINATTLRQCATDSSGAHYIELCNSNMLVGEFGCKVEKMSIDSSAIASSTSGFAVVYSNAGQQFTLGEELNINAGLKGCVKYEIGRGGAANDIWLGINCVQNDAATTAAFSFNAGSAQHVLRDSVCASAPSGGASTCILHPSGRLVVDTLDIEGYVLGLVQNNNTAGANSVFRNVQQNSASCSAVVQLTAANIPGNIVLENIAHSCPMAVQNAQSGGVNFTANIRGPTMCVSGACAAAVP